MSRKLLKQLSKCNLKEPAFGFVRGLSGGAYPRGLVAALDLFTKLPCPETAVNLCAVGPEVTPFMVSAGDGSFTRPPGITRPPGFEEWMESFEVNLRAVARIHAFLLSEAAADRVRIGFHRLRDQAELCHRLRQIGMKKGILANRRQFLRDTITKNASAFRAVIDMVCIHGVHDGRERFWGGLGAESTARLQLQSEIMYEVTRAVQPFVALQSEIEREVTWAAQAVVPFLDGPHREKRPNNRADEAK